MASAVPDVVHGSRRFPFSKGILAHDMVEAGLPVSISYDVAVELERELAGVGEIACEELSRRVADLLRSGHGPAAAEKYLAPRFRLEDVVVKGPEGDVPFSKGLLTRSIESSGIEPAVAYAVSRQIQGEIAKARETAVTRRWLRGMVYERLEALAGTRAAERYLVWRSIANLERPLVIAIGGAAGVGKTTVAIELAHWLGITGVISTDFIREIMRVSFSREMLPIIHKSSYEADEAVDMPITDARERLIAAFHEQARRVIVGVTAMIRRAETERRSFIVNGVHIIPGFLPRDMYPGVHIANILLATRDPEVHRARFLERETEAAGRSADRYLSHMENIREIQTFLLREADLNGVPVVDAVNLEDQTTAVVEVLTDFVKGLPDFKMAEI